MNKKEKREWKKEKERIVSNIIKTVFLISFILSAMIVTPHWDFGALANDVACDGPFQDCCWDYVGDYIISIFFYLMIVVVVWIGIVGIWMMMCWKNPDD